MAEEKYGLKEDGTLEIIEEGNDIIEEGNDEGVTTEEQDTQTEQAEQQEQKEQSAETSEEAKSPEEFVEPAGEEYTVEEIRKLGIDKLDPNKIPEELLPYYKSMQADYTRKTQKLAAERKTLEQEKKEIQEQLKMADYAASHGVPISVIQTARQQALSIVKDNLKDNFDEYNTEVQALITQVTNELVEGQKEAMRAKTRLKKVEEYLRKNDPDFDKINNHALYILENELPVKEYQKLTLAYQKGDVEPILELYRRAKQELQTKVNPTPKSEGNLFAENNASKPKPPATEKAGKGVMPQASSKVSARDFAGKNTDEQVKLLLDMGIL